MYRFYAEFVVKQSWGSVNSTFEGNADSQSDADVLKALRNGDSNCASAESIEITHLEWR